MVGPLGTWRPAHHPVTMTSDMSTPTPIATEPVIRVRGLVKQYGDIRAVDGIDFDVLPGEVFGLLGPTAREKRRRSRSSKGCAPRTAARPSSSAWTWPRASKVSN